MNIALLADIQINCSSKTVDRANDAKLVLAETVASLADNKPDYVVIAGDVFERYQTTDDERQLYANFIHQLLARTSAHIIVIDGNHDIRHRGFDYYDGNDTAKHANVLQSIGDSINNPRYHYSQRATFYEFDDVVFACWSELAKFDKYYGDPSPWHECAATPPSAGKPIYEVYHGTLSNCSSWSKAPLQSDDFEAGMQWQSRAVLAGHIHMPQCFKSLHGQLCFYPSSLLVRSFDEGDRYHNDNLEYDRMREGHGYMLITDAEYIFIPIHQPTCYVSMLLDNDCTEQHINAVLSNYVHKNAKFKVIVDSPKPEVLSYCYACISKHVGTTWKLYKTEAVASNVAASMAEQAEVKQVQMHTDAFVDIAKSILPAMNDDVLDKTLALLRQECDFHLHPDMPSKVRLHYVTIDNFKTIDHAELLFNDHGLYALSGNNGCGKTSVIEAICFACTGQPNAYCKPTHAKNKQLATLFNDKRPELDSVVVSLSFTVNEQPYTACTALLKTMRPGWTRQNWKSFVATVTKTVTITDVNDYVIATDDQAVNFLDNVFSNYSDFAILHSINQSTLDRLGSMDNADVANYILQRLGYSVLSKLQYYYDGCQRNALEQVALTDQRTYMQLTEALSSTRQSLQDKQQSMQTCNDMLTKAEHEVNTLQRSIAEAENALQPIDMQKYNDGLSYATMYNVQSVTDTIAQQRAIVQQAFVDNANYASLAAELTDKQQALQAERDRLTSIKQGMYQTAQQELTMELNKADQALQALQAEHDKLVDLHNQLAYSVVILESDSRSLQQSLQTLQQRRNQVLSDLDKLYDMTCPTCGHKLDNTMQLTQQKQQDLAGIDKQIEEATKQLDSKRAEHASTEAKLAEQDATIVAIKQSLQVSKQAKQSVLDKLSKLCLSDFDDHVDNAVANALQEQCNAMSAKLTSLPRTQVNDYYASIDKWNDVLDKLQYVETAAPIAQSNASLRTHIAELQSTLSASNAVIAEQHGNLARLDEQIKQCNADIDNLIALQERRANYDLMKHALKHYKWLAFDGLPKYLYSNAVGLINSFIDSLDMPQSICPRLSPTDYGMLVLVDRTSTGEQIVRPIQLASGMELTIAALTLCLALHSAKLTVDFPLLMIDEVSGKLNQGTAEDPTDYLDLFNRLLRKSSSTLQLLVVDHRLDKDCFDKCFNVIKDNATNTSSIC